MEDQDSVNVSKEHSSGVDVLSPQPPEQGLAGRELDKAVAERVFGLTLAHQSSGYGSMSMGGNGSVIHSETSCKFCGGMRPDADYLKGNRCIHAAPRYSIDIAAAMEVVEKMRGDKWSFACTLYEGLLPYASFCKRTAASSRNAIAPTLPEAICRAALMAEAHNAPVQEMETQ